jgi:hypothetical protein
MNTGVWNRGPWLRRSNTVLCYRLLDRGDEMSNAPEYGTFTRPVS